MATNRDAVEDCREILFTIFKLATEYDLSEEIQTEIYEGMRHLVAARKLLKGMKEK